MVPVFKAAGIAEMTSLAVPACYKSVMVSYTAAHHSYCHRQWWTFGLELNLTIMVYRRALVKPLVPTSPAAVLNSASKSDCDFAAPVVKVLP